ncbi:MAG TPA: response regulator transcription factor [Chitinophagaceae bacterium]|nr:response regulator transcription factor [Chitinophagaceae bacterium]
MTSRKKKILIVDDSPLIVKRLLTMLEDLPDLEWVKHAGSYTDGVEQMKTTEPGILLLDINLPDKSGIELLRTAKATNPSIKVIMITNQANEYYRKLCLSLGADSFIDKSKEFELIAEKIALMQ